MGSFFALFVSFCCCHWVRAREVPVFCNTVQAALHVVQWQPLLENLKLSLVHEVPIIGPVRITMERVELGNASCANCSVTAGDSELTVDLSRLDVDIVSFQFSYEQQRWPHATNTLSAIGNMAVSFATSLNLTLEKENLVDFEVGALSLHVQANKEEWLIDAMVWFAEHLKPVIGFTLQHVLRNIISDSLATIRQEGSCAAAKELLLDTDFVDLKVLPIVPVKMHVPTLGEVEFRLNVTHTVLPRSLACSRWHFNGTYLDMSFSDMELYFDFLWQYNSTSPSMWGRFWHNGGHGNANASLGCDVQLDFLRPATADIRVHLPDLDFNIDADSLDFVYRSLNTIFRPIVRRGIEALGGRIITRELECLADPPSCKRLLTQPSQVLAKRPAELSLLI